MKKIPFGSTSLQVSEYCLGAMRFGWAEPSERSHERLKQYLSAGGNFIDTANNYAAHHLGQRDYYGKDFPSFIDGENERFLGDWMVAEGNRHQLIIGTKLGFDYPGVSYGTSRRQIHEECEKSLRRLRTDYIDILYLHTDDRNTPLEESLSALQDLIREGKVRYAGASNFTAWRLAEAWCTADRLGIPRLCCIQQRHSYLRPQPGWDFGAQRAADDDLLDFVASRDIQLLAYSPLLGGFYNIPGGPLPPGYGGNENRLRVLREVAGETGYTGNQLVYYWLKRHRPSAIPLVSCSTAEQFEEAVQALEINLSEELWKKLDQAL